MFKKLVLSAFIGLAAASSSAESISIKYTGSDPAAPVLTTTVTSAYETGVMQYLNMATNTSFFAYCIEPSQPFAPTFVGARTYTVTTFDAPQQQYLQGLFSSTFASVDTAVEQAAFQLAIWEIVRETPGNSFNVSANDGSFYLKLTDNADVAAIAVLTNQYLAQAVAYNGPGEFTLNKLTNGSYQDLITISAVPEPQTYAMMLAGLGLVGLAARRRRNKA